MAPLKTTPRIAHAYVSVTSHLCCARFRRQKASALNNQAIAAALPDIKTMSSQWL